MLYKFVSKNFCNYFENNKPHIIKNKEDIKENNKNKFDYKNNDENNNDNNIYDSTCNSNNGKQFCEN